MESVGTVIIGGGPAGLGVCLAAAGTGRFQALLGRGLVVLEAGQVLGSGRLGAYAIHSDSLADSFLRFAETGHAEVFAAALEHPALQRLAGQRGKSVPLRLAAEVMAVVGDHMRESAHAMGYPNVFRLGVRARSAIRQNDGGWLVECAAGPGGVDWLQARNLVLATGAGHDASLLNTECVGGEPLLPRHSEKVVWSDQILTGEAWELDGLLVRFARPRIVICGGSHSAIACAIALLKTGRFEEPGAVQVLHRRSFQVTYPSPVEAQRDGCFEFGPDDICDRTGRVFPLAGFRAEACDFVRAQLGRGGLTPDPRAVFVDLMCTPTKDVQRRLLGADLIVAALGYRPNGLRLLEPDGREIVLKCATARSAPMVDEHSRVLAAAGDPVGAVFGIGLSSGYPMAGRYGERSFKGQANGLALWQTDIGSEIVETILSAKCASASDFPSWAGGFDAD